MSAVGEGGRSGRAIDEIVSHDTDAALEDGSETEIGRRLRTIQAPPDSEERTETIR